MFKGGAVSGYWACSSFNRLILISLNHLQNIRKLHPDIAGNRLRFVSTSSNA